MTIKQADVKALKESEAEMSDRPLSLTYISSSLAVAPLDHPAASHRQEHDSRQSYGCLRSEGARKANNCRGNFLIGDLFCLRCGVGGVEGVEQ